MTDLTDNRTALSKLAQSADPAFIVIKVGGEVAESDRALGNIIRSVGNIQQAGFYPILIHGGGSRISAEIEARGIPVSFVNGLRVTDAKTMEVTEMVLSGLLKNRIVTAFSQAGMQAVGISGCDAGLLTAGPHEDASLGRVGEIVRVNAALISLLCRNGLIPVISPVANTAHGTRLNINADSAAFAVAGELRALVLFLVTAVGGIYDGNRHIIPRVTIAQIKSMVAASEITVGMLPKTKLAEQVLQGGVGSVRICGSDEALLENSLLEKAASGTAIFLT